MSKIDDLLAEEGAAAESYEMPEVLPGHVRVSRPNLGRGTVVSVRVSDDLNGLHRRLFAHLSWADTVTLANLTSTLLHANQT